MQSGGLYHWFYRVALKFRDNPKLLENVTQIRKVLELMSDREFKNRYDVNEVCGRNNPSLKLPNISRL